MRILHVIPAIAPRYGGPSTAIWIMTAALNHLPGLEVEIATTDADGACGRLDPAAFPENAVRVHMFHRNFSERWKMSTSLWRWLRRHVRDYDLLHVHGLWSFSTAASCREARKYGVPVVLSPHGTLSPYALHRSALIKWLYWTVIERRNLASVCRFHVMSQGEAQDLASIPLVGRIPASVIPPGLDPDAWQVETRPDYLRQLCRGLAGDRPIVLFLGRLHPVKGIVDYLLPAWARIKKDAFLVIAGGTDDTVPEYEAHIRETITRLDLSTRVAMLGPVVPAERWRLFDGAAVFILPSYSENFGIVVSEALARRVPVVVSQRVLSSDHVTAAGAGHVVPLDVEAVAEALDGLLADPERRREMGERGRKYVQDHLNWNQIASHLRNMYVDCLTRQSRIPV